MKRKPMSYFNFPDLDFLFSKKHLQNLAVKSETYLVSFFINCESIFI